MTRAASTPSLGFELGIVEPDWLTCGAKGCAELTMGKLCGKHQRAFEDQARRYMAEQYAVERIEERWRWCERNDPRMAQLIGPIHFRDDGMGPKEPTGRIHTPAQAIDRIMADKRPIVTLVGLSRAGKTCIAAACLRAYSVPDATEWVDATKLGEASMESGLGDRAEYLRRADRAKFLVIDELRDPKHASKAANTYGVINDRHGRMRQTLVTTGMDPAQLSAVFGSGGMERLMEPESALVVYVSRRSA